MGKVFESIDPTLRQWIQDQKVYFVSTAPLSPEGLINCSPKGLDSFRVLDEKTVAYLDLVGSGAETIAHLRENKRITIMFCAFQGPPKIVRLYGHGEVIEKNTSQFDQLKEQFPNYLGARSIIKVSVHRIADSCGFAVPNYEFSKNRDTLNKWAENKGERGVDEYIADNNQHSLDGLPALSSK